MAIRMPCIIHSKQIPRRSSMATALDVPKGYFAVYVGQREKNHFVIPMSFLNQPSLQDFYAKLKKNLGLIIQWVVSQFPAARTY
ncbi:hypothetical protein LguiA_009041 [Lonicera macranthoides]